MNGTIGLEEHFAIPETLEDSAGFVPEQYWKILTNRLLDVTASAAALRPRPAALRTSGNARSISAIWALNSAIAAAAPLRAKSVGGSL